MSDQSGHTPLRAPKPLRGQVDIPRVALHTQLAPDLVPPSGPTDRHYTQSAVPHPPNFITRRPLYSTIEDSRERHYHLDYPLDRNELIRDQLDPQLPFYARDHPRTLDLPLMLPYAIELPRDQAKFLAHIVAHLYLAIKTCDVQGLLPVTAKDLADIRDAVGVLDVDLALETNLFVSSGADVDEAEGEIKDTIVFEGDDDLDDDDDDDDDDEVIEDAGDANMGSLATLQHKKLPKLAAVVGVRTWTQELLVWLKMKYDMPIKLRIALAKVYYALCLCRGQEINLKIYVKAFETLTKHTRFMASQGLELAWRPLYLEARNHLPLEDLISGPVEVKDQKQLLRLATRALYFFPKDATPEIFDAVGHHITFANALFVVLALCLVPNRFGVSAEEASDARFYLDPLFYVWRKLNKVQYFEDQMSLKVGGLAMEALFQGQAKLGDYGIFTEDQYTFVMNNCMNCLLINSEKFGLQRLKYFHGFALIMVYLITPANLKVTVPLLATLFNSIELFGFPLNSGDWSLPISKLVYALCHQLQKRRNLEVSGDHHYHFVEEYKLDSATIDSIVAILLPMVRTGIQLKSLSVVDNHLLLLGVLAQLLPQRVLEGVTNDLYELLEGLISTHRVLIALRLIEVLARYMASTPVFRVHLVRLLLMALPGIDLNDLVKTIHTLDVFATVANFVPFADLSDGGGDSLLAINYTLDHLEFLRLSVYLPPDPESAAPFQDVDLEKEALVLALLLFPVLMKLFCQRLFVLLENIPDPNTSVGLEKDVTDSLPKFVYVLVEALSDELFALVRQEIFDWVFSNTIHTVAEVAGEICGALIKREPSYFSKVYQVLKDKIKEEIDENGAGKLRTGLDIVPRDQALFWNLIMLNECIGNAGSEVRKHGASLTKFSLYLMDKVKGPAIFALLYIVNQMLLATTKIRLAENRLFDPTQPVTIDTWTPDLRANRDYHFNWYLPLETDIDFAVDCFAQHVQRTLDNVRKLIALHPALAPKTTAMSDEFRLNLLYLCFSLLGVLFLLDPLFDEDIPKLDEPIEQRLLLLKHIREQGGSKSHDKNYHVETTELERIVDDIKDHVIEVGQFDDDLEAMIVPKGGEDIEEPAHTLRLDRLSALKEEDLLLRSATPAVDGMVVLSMNPAITFRERKLYTLNYYFGDEIDQRRLLARYLQLHRTRQLIGKSLHMICKYFVANFSENTKLFKHLLYVINVYFSDVGRERVLDPSHARINYGYIKCIQEVNRVRKPYTRMAVGARLEQYHQLRVALHATLRNQTPLDKLLIEDIVKLLVSPYADIAHAAQNLVGDVLKRINGLYATLVKGALRAMTRALDEKLFLRVQLGLGLFDVKRVKQKIQNDYMYIERYIDMLQRCIAEVDEIPEVQATAKLLYQLATDHLTPPLLVCLVDWQLIDAIRPPDAMIDVEIAAVRAAKERKRQVYMDKLASLEELVLKHLLLTTVWWNQMIHILLLLNLQIDLNVPTLAKVLVRLAQLAGLDHPNILRLALKGLTNVVDKLYQFQLVDYTLANAYNLEFVPHGVAEVSTQGSEFTQQWHNVLSGDPNPPFYMDTKPLLGWLFWGDKMRVMPKDPELLARLSARDKRLLTALKPYLTKEWFVGIVKLWITENELNLAFQGSDATFIALLVMLVANGYAEFTCTELLGVVNQVYDKDDKATHMLCCEIIAGVLTGSHVSDPTFADERDTTITAFLTQVFDDLTPDTKEIWNIFSWWLPLHVDVHRFPKLWALWTQVNIAGLLDLLIRVIAPRIGYLRLVLVLLSWMIPNPDKYLEFCLDHLNYRYDTIRNQIGSMLAVLSFAFFSDTSPNVEQFIKDTKSQSNLLVLYRDANANGFLKAVPEIFERVERERLLVINKSVEEIVYSDYVYCATTILTWLRYQLKTSAGVLLGPFVVDHIVPFLLKVTEMKEVCQWGNINPVTVFKRVLQLPFNDEQLEQVVAMLEQYQGTLNVVQLIIMGEFTETVFFDNLFRLSREQRARMVAMVYQLLFNKSVEVREASALTFSGLIHMTPPDEVDDLIKTYKAKLMSTIDSVRRLHRKTNFKQLTPEDQTQLHGAVLGLGALVDAFLFTLPPPQWVAEILAKLAIRASGIPGVTGKTAKAILGRFKKNRQDTWHVDLKVFSEEQMEDLEGVLWKSYFI